MLLLKCYGMLALPMKAVRGSVLVNLSAYFAAAGRDVEAAAKAEVASRRVAAYRPLLPAADEIGAHVGEFTERGKPVVVRN